jgi:hypothetical protein
MQVKRREAKFNHYSPKRWHPEFDLIVYASFAGKSNVEIAKEFGYTPVHISNILSTVQADRIRNELRSKINDNVDDTITNRMKSISDKALERVEKFMNNDELFEKSPFAFVDRAMRAATLNKESSSDPKVNININSQVNNIGNEAISRIASALEISNEVKQLHSGLDPRKQILLEDTTKKK